MILRALYDYYNRCDNLPEYGLEEKEIGFLIVISKDGRFVRIEDCRNEDGKSARIFLVKKHVGRSSGVIANYLYDNSTYVLGYSDRKELDKMAERLSCQELTVVEYDKLKNNFDEARKKCFEKEQECFDAFVDETESIFAEHPDSPDLCSILSFYKQGRESVIATVSKDPLWKDVAKNLSNKYSTFSFRIDGDLKIVAEKKEIMQQPYADGDYGAAGVCIVTGLNGKLVETTSATMISGSQATAKLVSFQINSGYDSYGKTKCGNAPISEEAEFAYTTALNTMLSNGSRNKFRVGNRTFVFWGSSKTDAVEQAEESLFELLCIPNEETIDPNVKIEKARKVFISIYSGVLKTNLDDRFYILGLAPNSARIAVVYWSETSLRDFAGMILLHFNDMEIVDTRRNKKPYMGVGDVLSAVTLSGKQSDATPNLPEMVVKSIFQGTSYPYALFSACIRRIKADSGDVRIARAAILKAYLNRSNDNKNKKIEIMLDKSNTNQGYICGRLFAVLDRIQEDANGMSSIRERYMNAASSTPAAVFATILNLSSHHLENLANAGKIIYYEKIKQEIFEKISADGFPVHLDLQDQGRFFVGYYHQRQDFFTKNENSEN